MHKKWNAAIINVIKHTCAFPATYVKKICLLWKRSIKIIDYAKRHDLGYNNIISKLVAQHDKKLLSVAFCTEVSNLLNVHFSSQLSPLTQQ